MTAPKTIAWAFFDADNYLTHLSPRADIGIDGKSYSRDGIPLIRRSDYDALQATAVKLRVELIKVHVELFNLRGKHIVSKNVRLNEIAYSVGSLLQSPEVANMEGG